MLATIHSTYCNKMLPGQQLLLIVSPLPGVNIWSLKPKYYYAGEVEALDVEDTMQ